MRRTDGNIEKDSRAVVFRLSSLGDVVLTTGVLKHWFRTYGTRCTVITRSAFAPVFYEHPSVDSVIGLESESLYGGSWVTTARRLAREYGNRAFIDLHCTLRSHVVSMFWPSAVYRYPKYSLERRVYVKRRLRGLKNRLLATNIPQRYALALDANPPPHHELTPFIVLSDADRANAESLLSERHIHSPYIILHPYASHETKEWPRSYWNELVGLLGKTGVDCVVVGKGDSKSLKHIEPKFDLSNQTSIRTTCALMQRAQAVVSCDSGPVHLADAVSTPVIALFGPTIREWGFYPSGPKAVVLESDLSCRPCSLHGDNQCSRGAECMTSITPKAVFDTLISISSSAQLNA